MYKWIDVFNGSFYLLPVLYLSKECYKAFGGKLYLYCSLVSNSFLNDFEDMLWLVSNILISSSVQSFGSESHDHFDFEKQSVWRGDEIPESNEGHTVNSTWLSVLTVPKSLGVLGYDVYTLFTHFYPHYDLIDFGTFYSFIIELCSSI